MKILIPLSDDRMGLGWSFARALKFLGHEVTIFDPFIRLYQSPLWASKVSRRLLERQILRRVGRANLTEILAPGKFDAIFVIKGQWSLPEFWRAYKAERPRTRLVCYNLDDPITTWSRAGNSPWIAEAIPCYDLYVTYNQSLVEPLRDAGASAVLRLSFAWDPDIHPMQEFTDRADVVFIGNSDS